jgi:hypothetical protein
MAAFAERKRSSYCEVVKSRSAPLSPRALIVTLEKARIPIVIEREASREVVPHDSPLTAASGPEEEQVIDKP